ncbi:hypothetical protein BDQ17DRAFT_1282530 [Cyathus striatus]|nr:hypothetical protein BDQ17DRAFT_1282530 [Cyathus striatus]
MSKKVLSTGTLNLRFMQNANRLKQLEEVELDRAKLEDDGQWEVPKELKEAWGISSTVGSTETVTYESSYLPFLFPSTPEQPSGMVEPSSSNASLPKGRRAFDKKGREIVDQANHSGSHFDIPDSVAAPTADTDTTTDSKGKGKRRTPHPNSTTISLSNSGSLKGFDNLKKPKDNTKTAKQAIFESTSTGQDLRASESQNLVTVKPPAVFLKPSGVDEPSQLGRVSSEKKADYGLIDGARAKHTKREREGVLNHSNEESKRRKKKKKNVERT